MRDARAVRQVHLFTTDLAVRRILIVGDGFLVSDNFIQSAAVGAFKRLSHLTNVPWLGQARIAQIKAQIEDSTSDYEPQDYRDSARKGRAEYV